MVSISAAQDRVFHALADPSRRAILESLARWGDSKVGKDDKREVGEAAVKDLTARFNISQPAISQHLATLKHAGLVKGRRVGRCVYYRMDPRGMKPLIDWLAYYRGFWPQRIERLEQLLKRIDP